LLQYLLHSINRGPKAENIAEVPQTKQAPLILDKYGINCSSVIFSSYGGELSPTFQNSHPRKNNIKTELMILLLNRFGLLT